MKHFFYLLFHFKFRELMVEPTDDGFIQFFRFIFVGGSATLVDIVTGWLFVTYVFHNDINVFGLFTLTRDVLSVAIGFIIGLVVNYILSILWVFKRNDINRAAEFASFTVIGIVGLFIKSGVVAAMGLVLPQADGVPFNQKRCRNAHRLHLELCRKKDFFIWQKVQGKLICKTI